MPRARKDLRMGPPPEFFAELHRRLVAGEPSEALAGEAGLSEMALKRRWIGLGLNVATSRLAKKVDATPSDKNIRDAFWRYVRGETVEAVAASCGVGARQLYRHFKRLGLRYDHPRKKSWKKH